MMDKLVSLLLGLAIGHAIGALIFLWMTSP